MQCKSFRINVSANCINVNVECKCSYINPVVQIKKFLHFVLNINYMPSYFKCTF